jgi:hypothetical protein
MCGPHWHSSILTSLEQERDVAVKRMKGVRIWVLWSILLDCTPLHLAAMINFLCYLITYLNLKMRKNLVVPAVNRAAQNRTSSVTQNWSVAAFLFKSLTSTKTNYSFLVIQKFTVISLPPLIPRNKIKYTNIDHCTTQL